MKQMLPWRPIAECPPGAYRALVFDPKNVSWVGAVNDERIVVADRHDDGTWYVDSYQGGYRVEPTHYLDPGVPDGFPDVVDPVPLRARAEAERAAQEERRRQHEVARANARREAAEDQDPDRLRDLEASYERYWADPKNWPTPPQDT